MKTGDKVYVKVTSISKSHFETDFEGILGRNYHQQYGGGNKNIWSVHHPKLGRISWYDTSELTVIKKATLKDELKARKLDDYPDV